MESREAAAIEAFEQAEGQHTQRLKDFYLVTRARRRTLTLEDRECPMLGGISIATMEKNPSGDCGPAPHASPTDASPCNFYDRVS